MQWCFFIIIKTLIKHSYLTPSTKLLFFTRKILFYVNFGIAKTKYSKANLIDESFSYNVNCSGFISHIIDSQFPKALKEVKDFIKATEMDNRKSNVIPFCLHYYRFLQSYHPKQYWNVISKAKELSCGDMIIICEDDTKITSRGQHIMLIASEIKFTDNTWAACQVYDSVRYGHGLDNRSPDGINGVGEGRIALRVDTTGEITEVKWGPSDAATTYSKFSIARVKI